jgi:hypothetical protein
MDLHAWALSMDVDSSRMSDLMTHFESEYRSRMGHFPGMVTRDYFDKMARIFAGDPDQWVLSMMVAECLDVACGRLGVPRSELHLWLRGLTPADVARRRGPTGPVLGRFELMG